MFILSMFFFSTNHAATEADILINPQTAVNVDFATFSQSGDIEEPRSLFQRATSCLSGLKKKYVIPAALLATGALVGGITYWRLHTQDQNTVPPVLICPVASEEFWPIDPITSGILNPLISTISNNQVFFSTISSLWALSCNGFNSSSCTPSTSTFVQMMTNVGTIMEQNIDQEALKNYVLTYGTIECEVHPKSSKVPGRFVCYPCSDNSTEFCNGITDGFRGFRSPEVGFICPVNSQMPSSVNIFFYKESFYRSETSRVDTLFVFDRSNNIIGSKVRPKPFPVGNCTFYAEYLNQSAFAKSILETITCGEELNLVNLAGKNIGYGNMIFLAPALQQLTEQSVDAFDFSDNNIGDSDMETLAEVFSHYQNLYSLKFNNNRIGSNGLRALYSSIPSILQNLRKLSINNNNIGPDGMEFLMQTLWILGLTNDCWNCCGGGDSNHVPLEELNVGGNFIGDRGLVALFLAATSNGTNYNGYFPLCTLQYLDISNSRFSVTGITTFAEAFQPKFSNDCIQGHNCVFTSLKSLNVSNNGAWPNLFGDAGMIALAPGLALAVAGPLGSLDISNNAIGPIGATALSQAIGKNSLSSLFIQNNRIGVNGTTALFAHNYTKPIPILNIGSNGLGDPGAFVFSRVLSVNTSICWLPFANIYINLSDWSCSWLQRAYYGDVRSILDISNNDIGNDGAIAISNVIASALMPYRSCIVCDDPMLSIDASYNNISSTVCAKIKNIFANLTVPQQGCVTPINVLC